MFSLSLIQHDLPMPPHLLSRPLLDAIKAELERLFLDKVKRICFFFGHRISIVEQSLLWMSVIMIYRIEPFLIQRWWFLTKCMYLFAFGVYNAGYREPWAVRVCL